MPSLSAIRQTPLALVDVSVAAVLYSAWIDFFYDGWITDPRRL